jgi:WD40-like Beta Propeller Repeat
MLRGPSGRRRGLTLVLVSTAGLFVAVGLAIAVYLALVVQGRSLGPSNPEPVTAGASPSGGGCRTARLSANAGLGEVAWVEAGSLNIVDLDTCSDDVLLASGGAAPVRFSADGRWVAFGDGLVLPAAGGPVRRPFGSPVGDWEWSSTDDVLAGVTDRGALLVTRPYGEPDTLMPAGSGVGNPSFSPDGHRLAFDRSGTGIQVMEVSGGRARTILPVPDPSSVPEVAGWSPDGRWVLYWRGPVNPDGGPLDAVPAAGGPWANVFDPVLPYRDFIASCGGRIAVSIGSGQAVSVGKQIVLTGPPGWDYRNLTSDFARSWFWPACSPDGRWLAATDTLSQDESANRTTPRGLWLLATDGSSRRLLVPGTEGAPELPRWSSDGSVILAVLRTRARLSSPGNLLLVRLTPRSGRASKIVRTTIDVGSAPGPGGHQGWADTIDWHRPSAGAAPG